MVMGENVFLAGALLLPVLLGLGLWRLYRRVHAQQEPVRRRQVLLGNLLLLLCLAACALLAGEIYFRFFYDTTDSLMYTKASRRWLSRHFQMNTAGIRDNVEYHLFTAKGKRRITFLGDSFTVGHGVKNVEDRFANLIRAGHPDWEIHVLAHMGYETRQEGEFLNFWVTNRYQLDIVALVYCLNDTSDLMPERHQALERIDARVKNSGWLLNNSYFLNIAGHRWQAMRDPFVRGYFDLVRRAYSGPLWEVQKRRLTQLEAYSRMNGGRFVAITFPFLHALGPDYPFKEAHEALNRFWTERGVPHLDLLPLFDGLRPDEVMVNRFDAHPNERAHALVAPRIARFIKEQVRPPESANPASQ